ncbi:MAG: response regulator transcription factor [Bacteroidia bacterium]|nr:response regulator transcription factor [Bacteroidia bacterium]
MKKATFLFLLLVLAVALSAQASLFGLEFGAKTEDVKALLKRTGEPAPVEVVQDVNTVSIGNLVIDKERYLIRMGGEEMILPRKEFELLSLLVSKPGKVFTREEIYYSVWGDNVVVGDRTIDVHIRKLREKIGNDHIRTLKGIGYKFVE